MIRVAYTCCHADCVLYICCRNEERHTLFDYCGYATALCGVVPTPRLHVLASLARSKTQSEIL